MVIDPISNREFRSLRALALHYGLNPCALAARIGNGWTLLRALSTPVASKPHRHTHPVSYGGVTYPSVTALARAHGIGSTVLHARLRAGDTVEEALGRPQRRRRVKYQGVWYPSKAALASALGISARDVDALTGIAYDGEAA